ncbi:FxLYD domain-containing protein [Chloroflexota bacterium]
MKNRKWAISITLAALLFLVGCTTGSPAPKGELEVIDHSLTMQETSGVEIFVEVRNAGNSNIEFAEVEVRLYDEQDVLLYVLNDGVMNLRPRENWFFRFVVTEADCSDCRDTVRYDIETIAGTSSGGI